MKMKGMTKLAVLSGLAIPVILVFNLIFAAITSALGGNPWLSLIPLAVYAIIIAMGYKNLPKDVNELHEFMVVWILMAILTGIFSMFGLGLAGIELTETLTLLKLIEVFALTTVGVIGASWLTKIMKL